MNWIYYFDNQGGENAKTYSRKMYFRPIKIDEKEGLMGGNMVIMNVIAIEKIMENRHSIAFSEEQLKEVFNVYFNKLKDKDYYFEKQWKPKGHEDYLLCHGSLYLKVTDFSKTDLTDWIKVFLQIEGIPCDKLEESNYHSFSDENSFMRMLQKAATDGEKVLGKEWWKKPDK